MFTVDVILKLIVSVALTYIAVNSIFHYHFTIDRVTLFFSALVLLAFVSFFNTKLYTEFVITLIIVLMFYALTLFFFYKKRIHGYFMFNSYRNRDYQKNKTELMRIIAEAGIPETNLCYNEKKPFLYVLRNTSYKDSRKVAREMDKFEQKQPKSFNMTSYWHIIILLVLLVIIWRF